MESTVTTTTHHRLFITVPRNVESTANESTNSPMPIGPITDGNGSSTLPRRRPAIMPISRPIATRITAAKNKRLVKMSAQPLRSMLFSLVKISP